METPMKFQLSVAALLLITSGAAAMGAGAPDGHSCAIVVTTSDGFLSVRKDPSAGRAEVSRLKPGDFVDVSACSVANCSGSWRRISYVDWSRDNDGTHPLEGWVNARYLKHVACGDEP
jgi:hypothetical protein